MNYIEYGIIILCIIFGLCEFFDGLGELSGIRWLKREKELQKNKNLSSLPRREEIPSPWKRKPRGGGAKTSEEK